MPCLWALNKQRSIYGDYELLWIFWVDSRFGLLKLWTKGEFMFGTNSGIESSKIIRPVEEGDVAEYKALSIFGSCRREYIETNKATHEMNKDP